MYISVLVKLTSRAWATAILAAMHNGVPGRQAALISATGAGRTAFAQSLAHLMEMKLIERNPGHGHPLRPEFRLTEEGVAAAALSARIEAAVPDPQETPLLRRAWTIPILAVSPAPTSFSLIKRTLSPVTDRALSQNLQKLHSANWLSRDVDVDQTPPRPIYKATNVGLLVSRACTLQ